MAGFWETPPSVVCGILHVEQTSMAWAFGFRKLQPADMRVVAIAGRPYDQARNMICQATLDLGADFCFMLDSDVIPPPDAIPRLMNRNVPVISGVYHRRSPPHGLPVMQKNGQFMQNYPADAIIEVDTVGAGCLLIRRDLLEAMPPQDPQLGKHWFSWKVDRQHLLPPGEGMSEDFTFNLACRKMGVKTLVDTSIQCEHVGMASYHFGGSKPSEAIP